MGLPRRKLVILPLMEGTTDISKRGRKFVIACLIVSIFGGAYFIVRPNEIAFDGAKWRESPASDRWATNNLRYRMRTGAAAAAGRCRYFMDVVTLLGPPSEGGDFSVPPKGGEPAYRYVYDLGRLRHPVMFWESKARVELAITLDINVHVMSVPVEER